MQFRADLEAPAKARRACTARTRDVVPGDVADTACLLVSELVTNSIRYAHTPEEAEIELRATVFPDRVRVEVADHGPGFEPRPRGPDRQSRSGWGLFLVDEVSDRWGVSRTDGTSAWFEIDRA